MTRVSSQIRRLAEQVRDFDTTRNPSADGGVSAEFRTIDHLRPHLSMLMGRSGFQALLSRALLLATADVPWLAAVSVVGDGELEGLAVPQATIRASDFSEGEIAVVSQLIGLLVAFIGPTLTLRLINQIWPQLSFDFTDFGNATHDEEAK